MLIKGNARGNQLHGSYVNDIIFGNGGDDVIWGGNGNDQLHGGRGNDQIYEQDGGGADIIWGDKGNDFVAEGIDYCADIILLGEGDDACYSGTGFDTVVGGPGNDYVNGMSGDFWLDGGPGVVRGPAGNDWFVRSMQSDAGNGSVVRTGGGYDTIDIWADGRDWIRTNVTVTDFDQRFDRLDLKQVYVSDYGYESWWGNAPLLNQLDTNDNGVLEATDQWTRAGYVSVDHVTNSLTIHFGDTWGEGGDTLTLANVNQYDFPEPVAPVDIIWPG